MKMRSRMESARAIGRLSLAAGLALLPASSVMQRAVPLSPVRIASPIPASGRLPNGEATLRVTVERGRVVSITGMSSSHPRLECHFREAVAGWQFAPSDTGTFETTFRHRLSRTAGCDLNANVTVQSWVPRLIEITVKDLIMTCDKSISGEILMSPFRS